MRAPSRPTPLRRLALALVLLPAGLLVGACASAASPFSGTALWVREVAAGESSAQLLSAASAAGVRTLYIKAADGPTAEQQFSAVLVAALRGEGATVCAWTFAYGEDVTAEAAAAVGAVRDGAQCLVVDAEGQYDARYTAAQQYVRTLRAQLGGGFPIGLAGQAEVAEHPTFPYSVFLGPGGFNVDLPQMYWLELGVSVDRAYAATIGANALYGRPILPVGQLADSPAPAELLRFRALAGAYGAPGVSFFDLDVAEPQELGALAAPLTPLARRATALPTVRAGADGDEVVEAQERLKAAGAHLPVGGFYGALTADAVAAFQSRHHLPRTGVLGAATWRALLRFAPLEPSWAHGPPDSALGR